MGETAELKLTTVFRDNGQWKRWARTTRQGMVAHLFDFDDIRQAMTHPKKRLYERYAAIHLFERDGVIALVANDVLDERDGWRSPGRWA